MFQNARRLTAKPSKLSAYENNFAFLIKNSIKLENYFNFLHNTRKICRKLLILLSHKTEQEGDFSFKNRSEAVFPDSPKFSNLKNETGQNSPSILQALSTAPRLP